MLSKSLLTSFTSAAQLVQRQMMVFFDEQLHQTQLESLGAHLPDSVSRLQAYTTNQGKFIRPWLVLQGYLLAAGKDQSALASAPAEVLNVAGAVELLHRYILNLDDMADRDYLRHGEPTLEVVHRQRLAYTGDSLHHGRTMSEIEGALLCSMAYQLLNQPGLSAEQLHNILHIVNINIFRDTVAGWQVHYYQNFEELADSSEAEFVQGLELVTARYTFAAPLLIGLILGGGDVSTSLAETLRQFSKLVGIGYQLSDDILGLYGNSQETGKPVGNDIREGKKTLLVQRAYQRAHKEDKQFLNAVVGTNCTKADLTRVQALVKKTGALASVQEEMKQYLAQAATVISSVPNTELLVALVSYIEKRKY